MDVKSDVDAIRLDSFLPYQIALLADQVARRTAEAAKRHDGLNQSHWRVLAAVAEAPGRTANDVVAVTPMDKGIVSRAVKSLIDMDLVSRKASREDGRLAHLFLTAKGARLYQKIAREIRDVETAMTAALAPDERQALLTSLRKLNAAMKR